MTSKETCPGTQANTPTPGGMSHPTNGPPWAAQVHKARLADGREVAVKVQYAGLQTAVTADITTLSVLAAAATRWFPDAFDFGCHPFQPLSALQLAHAPFLCIYRLS